MPKVSVIVPVYNVEKYLPKCLDCLINQTLKDIEIICINDCSTDGSLAILKDYASKDKRIKILDLPLNEGAGNAKNKGLDAAKGEFIGFIDPDDCIDLNYYEELYNKATETNADIVKCELFLVEPDGRKTKRKLNDNVKRSKYYFSYDYTTAIYNSSLIFDNHITFPEELIVGEDCVFLNECVIHSKKLQLIDNVNYYYMKRNNSLNSEKYDEKRMLSAIKTVEYIVQNYNNALEKIISKDEYIEQYCANILTLLEFTVKKTDEKQLNLLCINKAIELFEKCPMQNEMEQFFSYKYKPIFDYIKNHNVELLLEVCLKHDDIYKLCTLEMLRNNVKKNMNRNTYKEVL